MEKIIESRSNPLIKELSKLKQKKYRDEIGLVLVEGERFVTELACRKMDFRYVLYCDTLPKELVNLDCEHIKCTSEVLTMLAQTQNSSNIIGVVKFNECNFIMPKTNFLILDNIQDPGNLGTIIRSALAFGFTTLYLFNCVDYLNDKVLRATMGTIADVKLIKCQLDELQKLKDYIIFDASMQGVELDKVTKPSEIFGIILGNEANGVSDSVSKIAKQKISIKMKNQVESLNVAIAGAIIMNKLS